MVSIGDNRDYLRVLFYSYYTTITGWGVLLRYGTRSLEKRACAEDLQRECHSIVGIFFRSFPLTGLFSQGDLLRGAYDSYCLSR